MRFASNDLGLAVLRAASVLVALISLLVSRHAVAYEYVFSEFNGTGFGGTSGSGGLPPFQQVIGPDSVRLFHSEHDRGSGYLYLGNGLDFSDFAHSKVKVDFEVGASNESTAFQFQLWDTDNNYALWKFNLAGANPAPVGVPLSWESPTTLTSPSFVSGDFDLTSIKQFAVLGAYGVSTPFDLTFDRISVTNELPYVGAPDAAWYAEAASRIDEHRKADLQVVVRDVLGNPLSAASIQFAMQEHEFRFGTAVATPKINDTSADGAIYREKLLELFNSTTTENALKWQPWAGDYDPARWTEEKTLAALDWLAQNDMPVRGHNLLWPGADWLPEYVMDIIEAPGETSLPLSPAGQEALRQAIHDHIDDIVSKTAGKVMSWDVVNEPRNNRLLMEALDENNAAMIGWFNRVRDVLDANNAEATLFVNEFNIVTKGGRTDAPEQQTYFDQIQALINGGAAIDGLGIQGHFRPDTLTGPEKLWEIFDRFAEFDLSMEVTEFDLTTTDRELQATYLRDFFTAAFAHEAIDGVTQWGFWAGSHPRPDAALFDLDWTPRPHGEAYVDLVFEQWWTDEERTSDAEGTATVRGFKGQYEIVVQIGDRQIILPVTLSDGGAITEVVVEILPGDFNEDGTVNTADYTVWRDRFGATVPLYRQGDGNGDGIVDEGDYLVWKSNFGLSLSNLVSASQIPEPSGGWTLMLLCLLTTGVYAHRRTVND